MYTQELLPILREFKGKKCCVKLMNGETIYGAMGELVQEDTTVTDTEYLVNIFDATNNKIELNLSNINALRLD